jgi:flagellar hook-associated protein 3 FlgL
VLTGDSAAKVFMDIPASGGGMQNVFKTLTDLVNGLNANNPSQSSLDNIQSALKNVLTVQTEVGSRLNAISNQKNFNDNVLLQTKQSRSQIQDLNFAQAVSKYQQQLVALQAAQASYSKIQNLSLFNYLR